GAARDPQARRAGQGRAAGGARDLRAAGVPVDPEDRDGRPHVDASGGSGGRREGSDDTCLKRERSHDYKLTTKRHDFGSVEISPVSADKFFITPRQGSGPARNTSHGG